MPQNLLRGRAIRKSAMAALAAVMLSGAAAYAKEATQPIDIKSFSGAYLAARVAETDNDLDGAIQFYKRALGFDPENQAMQQSLMLAFISSGRLDESLPYAEKLKTVPEVERFSRVALAVRDIRDGRNKDAQAMLKLSLSSDLDKLIAGLMTAWAQQGDGDAKGALETIDKLQGPEWFGLFKGFHRALIAEVSNMPADADKAYAAVLDDSVAGGAAPDTWLRAAEAYASFLARKGDKARAIDVLDKAEQFATGRLTLTELRKNIDAGKKLAPLVANTKEGAAEVLLDLGAALNRGGGEPFVRLYLQLALALTPKSDTALLQLATFAEQQEDSEAAIELYRRIPADSPMRRAAELQLGLNLADLDRHAEAEADLKKVLASDPNDLRAYLALGGVYSSQEKYADAAKNYDQAVKILETPSSSVVDKEVREAVEWNIYYQRGISYERLKQWDKAEPNFRKALELSPNQPQVLNYLGYSMVDMGRNLDEALGMIQKAVELRPSDGYIVDSLGWAFYKLGRYPEAVTELERAVSLKPDDPVLNDHLGDGYWRVGRKLEATFQWSHARDLKPDPEVLESVKKKLSEGLPDDPGKATAQDPAPPAVEPPKAKNEQRTQAEPEVKAAEAKPNEVKPDEAKLIPATYKVQAGQSLWSIARDTLGSGDRYIELISLNPSIQRDPNRIYTGQELVLPGSN